MMMMKMTLEDHEKEDDIDLENHENDIVDTNSIEYDRCDKFYLNKYKNRR